MTALVGLWKDEPTEYKGPALGGVVVSVITGNILGRAIAYDLRTDEYIVLAQRPKRGAADRIRISERLVRPSKGVAP